MTFEIKGSEFVRDGKPIKLISGAIHYFRNPHGYWEDVFCRLKAMGCNCVETYCAWNLHEAKQGEFNFDGDLNIAEFVRLAGKMGLMAIVRPGPYICAEWEFGGLPWWLQAEQGMEIRCMNKQYLKYFDRYLDELLGRLRPLLCTNGGPIIMMQIENEYGYYGDDKQYLDHLYDGYRRRGIDVPLFTSDGVDIWQVTNGSHEKCLCTLNFGTMAPDRFDAQQALYPNTPKMCAEMWDGWFDHWGDVHHTTDAKAYAEHYDEVLKVGSANIYMLIGGTNFGFMNGANHFEKFEPTVTSYDYDALLSECGDITEKYMLCREVAAKYAEGELPKIPANRPKKAYGRVALTESAALLDNLNALDANPISLDVPLSMEDCSQGYGYIAYTTVTRHKLCNKKLVINGLGDRAQIYVGNELVYIMYINDDTQSCEINAEAGDTITIVVENMGRTNFGEKMMRKKGIAGRVTIGGIIHFGWTAHRLEMTDLSSVEFKKGAPNAKSAFWRGTFDVDNACDTFLRTDDFTKGVAFINGFNLGRYWEIGPTKTLYVPKFLLREGENEIIVFDSDGAKSATPAVEFTDKPDLG